jgi:hypothetical protein
MELLVSTAVKVVCAPATAWNRDAAKALDRDMLYLLKAKDKGVVHEPLNDAVDAIH